MLALLVPIHFSLVLPVLVVWIEGPVEVIVLGLTLGVQVGDLLALALEGFVLLFLRVVVWVGSMFGISRWSVESTRLIQRLIQRVVIRIEPVALVVAP